MELLSYNGGYIGYNASLNEAKPPYDSNVPSNITDWTVNQLEANKTNNIHIVGTITEQFLSGNTFYRTQLSGGFYAPTSDNGGGANYIRKGDVIVCWAYADTYSATFHASGTAFIPKFYDGSNSTSTSFTTINSRLNNADANVLMSYFIATKDTGDTAGASSIAFTAGTSSATGQYQITYNIIVIRGLTADANLNTLQASIFSGGFNTGTTGLPYYGAGSLSIPVAAVEGVSENWIVLTGWAVDDDINGGATNIMTFPGDFTVASSTGVSASGGSSGITAQVASNSSSTSTVTVFVPEIKYFTGTTTANTTLANDAWITYQIAFKAGVEVQAKILPKNSGIWNLTTNTIEPPKSVWYRDQFSKGFPYYDWFNTIEKQAKNIYNYFVIDNRATNPYPYVADIVNYSQNTTFETQLLKLEIPWYTYSIGTRYTHRLYVKQPCRIRFKVGAVGNSSSTYCYATVSRETGGQVLFNDQANSPSSFSSGQNYTAWSSYYTVSSPEYLKLYMSFQTILVSGQYNYPYSTLVAEITTLNV